MAINRSPVMTVEDYFEWELQQERKHEYIDGAVYEMPGVSNAHSLITTNLIYLFVAALADCYIRSYVRTARTDQPDALRIPRPHTGARRLTFADPGKYNLTNPVFVVEVTSPTSTVRDRRESWSSIIPGRLSKPASLLTSIAVMPNYMSAAPATGDIGVQRAKRCHPAGDAGL